MEEWIVQYVGDEKQVFSGFAGTYESLLGGYAIVSGDKKAMEELTGRPEILYVEGQQILACEEQPGRIRPTYGICLQGSESLGGEGVLMAYLDSGIDYRHPEFLTKQGQTRIRAIYDLSVFPPMEYTKEQITNGEVSMVDLSGHGTHVAAIGSGNSGVAPKSELVIVKIAGGLRDESSTTTLMRGVDYCVRKAMVYGQPMVINISYGNTYGPHDGSSLVEQYLDEMMNYGKLSIVVGAGNEGDKAGHAKGVLRSDETVEVAFSVGTFQAPFSLQLWKRYEDEMTIRLLDPAGEQRLLSESEHLAVYRKNGGVLRIESLEPTPHRRRQAFFLHFSSEGDYVPSGEWKFLFTRRQPRCMEVNLWLPASPQLSGKTMFTKPVTETTVTIPGTATRAITVGAYDERYEQLAAFSGRGYAAFDGGIKPDLVAPGVDVLSALPGGGYTFRSGTSMATPFVSGAAALLMEWGIVKGRDPFLYADRLKAFLLRGAQPLSGQREEPNPGSGWGRLCIRKSIP